MITVPAMKELNKFYARPQSFDTANSDYIWLSHFAWIFPLLSEPSGSPKKLLQNIGKQENKGNTIMNKPFPHHAFHEFKLK